MYEVVKAVHVTAIVTWMGAMIVTPMALAGGPPAPVFVRLLRTTLSIGLVATWCAGLWLATTGDWFRADWLQAKLAIVIALSALHGVLSGRLRKAVDAADRPGRPAGWAWLSLAIVGALFAIATLAILKPNLWT
jgi:protoporphyrinogen IX oxidase